MQLFRAMKMRIYPSAEQKQKIDTTLDCSRFVYNHMLSRNVKVYQRRSEHLSYNEMQNLLPVMKTYLPWLKEADSKALQHACRQLEEAYRRFFKHQGGFPRHKKKRRMRHSYTTTNAASIQYDQGNVKLPCLGWVKTKDKRTLHGTVCRATVSREGNRYYVSITYKTEKAVISVKKDTDNILGLDYKTDCLYVDSNGNTGDMPPCYQKSQTHLAKRQRQLSKKQGARKGERPSERFKQKQAQLQKIQRHTANQRKDFLHNRSAAIAKRYDAVAIEDLSVKELLIKDAEKSCNRQKHNINRATMNNGWYTFTQMLEYKLAERGRYLIRTAKDFPSSERCSDCGHIEPSVKDLSVRKWKCPQCGAHHDRDINAAVNIRAEGIRLLRTG